MDLCDALKEFVFSSGMSINGVNIMELKLSKEIDTTYVVKEGVLVVFQNMATYCLVMLFSLRSPL